jgi:hypothetical protein
MTSILSIIATILTIIIGLWKYFQNKNKTKRELAERAQKELDDAQKTKINLLCLMLGMMLIGCGSSGMTEVYVLNNDEIVQLSPGEAFTAPYAGTFYSNRAEQRVMHAKIVAVNLK